MNHEIGPARDGGYSYTTTISGIIATGWRQGTKEEVEKYVAFMVEWGNLRAQGHVPRKIKDGSTRINWGGKQTRKKKCVQQLA